MPDFLSFTARVIDVSNGKGHVAESCLEETGGLGVDIVIDAGGGYLCSELLVDDVMLVVGWIADRA